MLSLKPPRHRHMEFNDVQHLPFSMWNYIYSENMCRKCFLFESDVWQMGTKLVCIYFKYIDSFDFSIIRRWDARKWSWFLFWDSEFIKQIFLNCNTWLFSLQFSNRLEQIRSPTTRYNNHRFTSLMNPCNHFLPAKPHETIKEPTVNIAN